MEQFSSDLDPFSCFLFCGQLTAMASLSNVTEADSEVVSKALTSHSLSNIEHSILNTCQRGHSEGLGHSRDGRKDLASIRLDPISSL